MLHMPLGLFAVWESGHFWDVWETTTKHDKNQGKNIIIIIIFITSVSMFPREVWKKLEKMKRLGMSKIPCGHKRAYFHVEEQRLNAEVTLSISETKMRSRDFL